MSKLISLLEYTKDNNQSEAQVKSLTQYWTTNHATIYSCFDFHPCICCMSITYNVQNPDVGQSICSTPWCVFDWTP